MRIIYVVLTYRNTKDLYEFLVSLKETSDYDYKVIVINNFFDEDSLNKMREIANDFGCIFIENENTGYSSGNNKGIKYALDNLEFEYLIVSNADIQIKKLSMNQVSRYKKEIIAPDIITIKGKKQNPLYYREIKSSEKLIYKGLKNNKKFYFYLGIILNKINKIFNRLFNFSKRKKVFAPHGAFIIFTRDALEKIIPVFDDKMFLFCEESVLARNAIKNEIDIIYDNKIMVKHKEDGSMNFRDDLDGLLRKSYLYYYEKYHVEKGDE